MRHRAALDRRFFLPITCFTRTAFRNVVWLRYKEVITKGRPRMSDQLDAILAALSRLEHGQTNLQAELSTTRTQITERLDQQQARLDAMSEDLKVNWHSTGDSR